MQLQISRWERVQIFREDEYEGRLILAFSCGGVEALVLPVEFPAGAGAVGDCPVREVGEGVIDRTGVEKSRGPN